jgi:hypothetical protein
VGCYLDIESLIQIAKDHNVDAIHPGYGFLSENAQLSRRCQEEGIKFVGPPPEVINVRCTPCMLALPLQPVCAHCLVQARSVPYRFPEKTLQYVSEDFSSQQFFLALLGGDACII